MSSSEGEAGPSRSPAKPRVSRLADSDSEDEAEPISLKRKRATGDGERKHKGKVDEAERKRRTELANRLYEQRQELPFYQGRKMILNELVENDTIIILGETGCGKSTQLSQLLRTHAISLDHFGKSLSKDQPNLKPTRFNKGPSIVVTQPRRLPAIALANRVAAEMGCAVGGEVGYSVRFEETTSKATRIRYMTEGVLMRELANSNSTPKKAEQKSHLPSPPLSSSPSVDPAETPSLNLLLKYDVIVLDEAHERTLNTDFLLGSLKKIQRIRRESGLKAVKLVIMSATLDPRKFENFFNGAPVLFVKGRMYNVHTAHVLEPVDDFIEAAAVKTMHIHRKPPVEKGDVLVFMPGSEEIENLVALLKRVAAEIPATDMQLQVLPLYSSLPPTAQAKIFTPTPKNTRRVIVATNIAETSLTIPGIGFVIDSGYRKEKEYIYRTSGAIEHLKKMEISKASAWQRSGRAGRESEGKCFRLYTEQAFVKLPEESVPEIQRCNLASAVLQLVAMGQDPFEFEYIDNPGRDPILAAFRTLAGLGALASPTTITSLGRSMLKYPLDPEHSRILIASFEHACPLEIIDILSILVSGPIFLDRPDSRENSAAARLKFIHRDGDHLTSMNVLRAYVEISATKVAWCRENFVNGKTMQAALKVRTQLRELCEKDGRDWRVSAGNETEGVMKSLLSGLFMNTAIIQADGTYRQTAGSLQVKIHPSSVLMSKKVPAIVYDELTITSSIYARNVSAFEQHWLAEIPWFKHASQGVPQGPSKAII
ncbi:hypothetical protein P7C73_g1837, partial [Tremellales sp. Uapishka_1]